MSSIVRCSRGWSPDCLGHTRVELPEGDGGGDPELSVLVVVPPGWTFVEVRLGGEWVERACCAECLSNAEASFLLAQRAQAEEEMRVE